MSSHVLERLVLKPSAPPTKPIFPVSGTKVSSEHQVELASSIKKASMGWASQVSQMQYFDVEFANRLAACSKPADAVAVCNEWMARRIDSAVSMQHKLLELWLNSVTATLCQKAEAHLAERGNHPRGSPLSPAEHDPKDG